MSRYRLIIDSNLGELFAVSVLIRGVCEHLGTDEADASILELCAVEAATNVVKHAYCGVPGQDVILEMSCSGDRIDLKIIDYGQSMPDKQIEQLQMGSNVFDFNPDSLELLPERGMGLEIIRRGMNEAAYSTCDGVNCLSMTRFLAAAGSKKNEA